MNLINNLSPALFVRKIFILILGLFVLAFGISLCSATDLGVSPSQSVSYIMSIVFQGKLGIQAFSWGVCTTILNLLFFLGQIAILRKDFKPVYVLQMVVVFAFSYFTDLTKSLVNLMGIETLPYIFRLLIQIGACAVIGLGIYLQLKAELIVMATEGFVNAISRVIKKDFGITKIIIDWGCVALTAIISLLVLGYLDGVREGTVINAFLNGYFVRVFSKHIRFLDKFVGFEPDVLPESAYISSMVYPLVITIDREIGSGGGLIAEAISQKLGIKLYDYELLQNAAKKSGLPYKEIEKKDERLGTSILAKMAQDGYDQSIIDSKEDEIFHAQAQIIKNISAEESCVILGRLGSFILKNRPNTMKLFFSADPQFRAKVVGEKLGLPFDDALKYIKKEDAMRVNYCRHFTGTGWGIACHYGMTLHTSDYGIGNSIKLVLNALESAICKNEDIK